MFEYQDLIVAVLQRVHGKDAHSIEKSYSGMGKSYIIIAIQLAIPLASAFVSIECLYGISMVWTRKRSAG